MDTATIQAMKGSATPMASMFQAEEAQKAAVRVHDKIAEYQHELQKLRSFASDNTSLVNSVERLPNELHHDIMVPFGKAAFFPGRLIHTNEFMVLLGEGYYAERTSRQTMEILKRRGKVLDEQVNYIKASMRDLEAEASFFNSTATEADEGITDIIEDYVSETESESGPDTDSKKVTVDDEEYERIMAKFEELEREELAAGSQSESDEDAETDSNQFPDESLMDSISSYIKGVQLGKPAEESQAENTTIMEHVNMDDTRQLPADQLNFEGLTVRSLPRDANLPEKSSSHNLKKPSPEKVVISPGAEEQNAPAEPSTKNEVSRKTSRPSLSDNSKAFTGSIVERSHNLQTNPRQQSTASSQSESQPSKPVSRFKMQRR